MRHSSGVGNTIENGDIYNRASESSEILWWITQNRVYYRPVARNFKVGAHGHGCELDYMEENVPF